MFAALDTLLTANLRQMELEALVQQMGFLPFFSCSILNFSIEEFTPGRYWFVNDVDGPWEWRMKLACRGVVAYSTLDNPNAFYVSKDYGEAFAPA